MGGMSLISNVNIVVGIEDVQWNDKSGWWGVGSGVGWGVCG